MAKTFVKMSVELLARTDLSLPAKVVLSVIMDHMREQPSCWPGIRRLCKITHLDDSTITRAIRGLEVAGLLAVERRESGKSNVYSLPKRPGKRDGLLAQSAPESGTVAKSEAPRSSQESARSNGTQAPAQTGLNRETKKQRREDPKKDLRRAAPKKERPKNELWDAIVAEWFADGIPDSQRANVGKFVKEFRQLKATPAEIGIRRKRIRECWGPGTDTPASTVKHWSEFQDDQRAHNDRPGRRGEHPEPKKPSLPRL